MATRLYASYLIVLCLWAPLAQSDDTPRTEDPQAATQSVLPLEDLRVFTKAYEHIRSSYIKEIDDQTLLEYAIRGMLEQLDPHSVYLDASSFDDLQVHTTGEFGGLGIEVSMEDGFIKVVSPIDDTPAERAGVEAGDLIIKIDDTTIKGLSLNEAVDKMRGPKGSEISLTIVREGVDQPLELTLVRDIIQVKSVRTELIDDHYAYVRIAQFQVNTGSDMVQALRKMQKKTTLNGLVLDLRNNPGGVLQSSFDVVDAFLDGGLVVYTEGRMPHSNVEYTAEPGDVVSGLPIVVLINEGSASASEIVAGALQDHRRAVVAGTRSFGKGSVQTVIPITDDRAIKMTTALYFTPNGRSIQAQGIEPDIIVGRAQITAINGQKSITEAQLAGHLSNGKDSKPVDAADKEKSKGKKDPKKEPKEAAEPAEDLSLQSRDNQLYEAINLLKGLNIFKQSRTIKVPQDEPSDG